MKRAYELMAIIDSDAASADVEAVITRVAGLITGEGAFIASTNNWGRREFAYEINHKTEGIYVVWEVVTETAGLPTTERQLRIADGHSSPQIVPATPMTKPHAAAYSRMPCRLCPTKIQEVLK